MRDVPGLIAAWARRRPTATAVVTASRSWTYAELAADVACTSEQLISAGVGPEVAVGVLAHRSYQLVVGFLAALESGGVYVPIHPGLPEARQQALIGATGVKAVLAEEALVAWAYQICPAECAVLDTESGCGDAVGPLEPRPDRRRAPGSAAYVIQTSGSTGRPKSIAVPTDAMHNLIEWTVDVCGMDTNSRVAQVYAANFDASVKMYLAPFACGATLVLLPDTPYSPGGLLDFVSDNRITILNCIPSMIYPVMELAGTDGFRRLNSLRVLALGTETPDLSALRPWIQSQFFQAKIFNMYGPTECTSISCYAAIGVESMVQQDAG